MSSKAARFSDSYYVFNTFLCLLYVPLRLYFKLVTPDGSDYGTLHSLHELSTWVRCCLTVAAAVAGVYSGANKGPMLVYVVTVCRRSRP